MSRFYRLVMRAEPCAEAEGMLHIRHAPGLSLATLCGSCFVRQVAAAKTPDGIAGKHKLDPAILLSPIRGVVRCYWRRFSKTTGGDRVRGNALLHKVIAHRLSALFGKLLIVLITANAVGVTLDRQVQRGIGEHDT